MVEEVDLTNPPEWLEATFDGEPVHGWWAITEQGPTCEEGCLAPGSSPHSHSTIVGYTVITNKSRLRFTVDGVCVQAGMLHPAPAS